MADIAYVASLSWRNVVPNPNQIALQMMVTGMLLGSMLKENEFLDIDVTPSFDENDDYMPEFTIKGNQSGTVLRVKVEVEE